MPEQRFSVSVDPDALARQDLAAALTRPAADGTAVRTPTTDATHHGARDARQAARLQSERARAGRQAGSGRSYAFRRS